MKETPTPSKETLDNISNFFADYMKPAGAIHRELVSGNYTLQMVWNGFQVFADVTSVVNEAQNTGRLSAHGMFNGILDDLLLRFAREIVQRDVKLDKKEEKKAMRSSKILRLVEK